MSPVRFEVKLSAHSSGSQALWHARQIRNAYQGRSQAYDSERGPHSSISQQLRLAGDS